MNWLSGISSTPKPTGSMVIDEAMSKLERDRHRASYAFYDDSEILPFGVDDESDGVEQSNLSDSESSHPSIHTSTPVSDHEPKNMKQTKVVARTKKRAGEGKGEKKASKRKHSNSTSEEGPNEKRQQIVPVVVHTNPKKRPAESKLTAPVPSKCSVLAESTSTISSYSEFQLQTVKFKRVFDSRSEDSQRPQFILPKPKPKGNKPKPKLKSPMPHVSHAIRRTRRGREY